MDELHNNAQIAEQWKESSSSEVVFDQISTLPDCLIHHILSFLRMPDVVKTCVLSTRWRYLWTTTPCLNFMVEDDCHSIDSWKLRTPLVEFIDTSLLFYQGLKVEVLRIQCEYNTSYSSRLGSWIRFAIRHNVEELGILLCDHFFPENVDWSATRQKSPHSLFYNKSLKTLALSFFDINLPVASLQLYSLTRLILAYVDLSSNVISRITSECPLLTSLVLMWCNKCSNLLITIARQNLQYLEIYEFFEDKPDTDITICAPNLQNLVFEFGFGRATYNLNVSSLLRAYLGICPNGIYLDDDDEFHKLGKLLVDLQHIQELRLGIYFVLIASTKAVQKLEPLSLKETTLILEADFTRLELPGISYLLKSSSHIDILYIVSPKSECEVEVESKYEDKFAFEEKDFWDSEKYNFSSVLEKLQFVEIQFLTDAGETDNVQEVLDRVKNKIEFVRFLLKNLKGLQYVNIRCGKNNKLNHDLLSIFACIPRASPNVSVDII